MELTGIWGFAPKLTGVGGLKFPKETEGRKQELWQMPVTIRRLTPSLNFSLQLSTLYDLPAS